MTNGEFAPVDKGVRVLTVCKALERGSLPEGPKVVDVGGGVGTSSLRIARDFSNVECILQDFPEVCGQTKSVCYPLYISSISDILTVAMDERSPGSGGRRSSRFPTSRLFLSSAYQRRLRFHP